jgi:hypothetical protein
MDGVRSGRRRMAGRTGDNGPQGTSRLTGVALLARVEPRLLYPVRHRGERAHRDLAVVKARAALVRQWAGLINAIRGMVKASGGRLPRS